MKDHGQQQIVMVIAIIIIGIILYKSSVITFSVIGTINDSKQVGEFTAISSSPFGSYNYNHPLPSCNDGSIDLNTVNDIIFDGNTYTQTISYARSISSGCGSDQLGYTGTSTAISIPINFSNLKNMSFYLTRSSSHVGHGINSGGNSKIYIGDNKIYEFQSTTQNPYSISATFRILDNNGIYVLTYLNDAVEFVPPAYGDLSFFSTLSSVGDDQTMGSSGEEKLVISGIQINYKVNENTVVNTTNQTNQTNTQNTTNVTSISYCCFSQINDSSSITYNYKWKQNCSSTEQIIQGIISQTQCESKTETVELNDTLVCTQEAKQCSDGSYVSRNVSNNCEFNSCPPKPFNWMWISIIVIISVGVVIWLRMK